MVKREGIGQGIFPFILYVELQQEDFREVELFEWQFLLLFFTVCGKIYGFKY